MSKFPEYKHTKSHEYFDRAIKVIPSGIYGHLGSLGSRFKMAFLFRKSKGYIFLGR